MRFSGKAWVFGTNVNTDLIFPKTWFRPSCEPGEMASHLMVGIDEEFRKKVGRGKAVDTD
jgi:3-isopropylmalate dehydratase small subunit